jgi:hypothetical protein
MAMSVKDNRQARGDTGGNSVLREGLIPKIFELRALGFTFKKIATLCVVNWSSIQKVIYRKTWAHVHVPIQLIKAAQSVNKSRNHNHHA